MTNAALPLSRVMTTLVKREFLEHRLVFLYFPLAWAGMWIVFAAASVLRALQVDTVPLRAFAEGRARMTTAQFLDYPEQFRGVVVNAHFGVPQFFMMGGFWLTMATYFLLALHQQRKNRSILFWHSLPVSDTQMLASKLIAGLVCCHVLYVACYLVVALFMILALLAFGSLAGIDAWATFIAPADIFSRFVQYFAYIPLNILWTLPVYAWLLLVSGWAKQAPFVWAVGPLLIIIYVEFFFTGDFAFQRQVLMHALPVAPLTRGGGGVVVASAYPWSELVLSAVLGLALLYGAIRLNRSEDN